MRKKFSQLIQSFRSKWEDIAEQLNERDNIPKADVTNLLKLETMIFAFEASFPLEELTLSNIQSMYVNQETLLPENMNNEATEAARVFFGSKMTKNYLRSMVKKYEVFPLKYRLYKFSKENEQFVPNIPNVFQKGQDIPGTFVYGGIPEA